MSFLTIRRTLTKRCHSLEKPEDTGGKVSATREKTSGYSPLKVLKIVDWLFLLCSRHCLETPSIVVFFSSDQKFTAGK